MLYTLANKPTNREMGCRVSLRSKIAEIELGSLVYQAKFELMWIASGNFNSLFFKSLSKTSSIQAKDCVYLQVCCENLSRGLCDCMTKNLHCVSCMSHVSVKGYYCTVLYSQNALPPQRWYWMEKCTLTLLVSPN